MHADDSAAQDATSMSTSEYADVLLVSQATGNISDFAEISTRINAAYARRHGYGYVVAHGHATNWVHDRDVRWSKVAILRDIISNGRFKSGGGVARDHGSSGGIYIT